MILCNFADFRLANAYNPSRILQYRNISRVKMQLLSTGSVA